MSSSADEAKVLARLNGKRFDYVYTRDYDKNTNLFSGHAVEIDALPRDDLFFPGNVGFYMEHLDKLGLAGIYQHGNQAVLTNASHVQIGVRIPSKYRLTDFGEKFVRACIKKKS